MNSRIKVISLFGALALGGCSQHVVIAKYPIKRAQYAQPMERGSIARSEDGGEGDGDPGHEDGERGGDSEGARYWSAYVYVDPHNIVREWNRSGLNHVLVNAEVRIPSSEGPIVRRFPLFSIESGSIQQHSGIDVLQKVPLLIGAREQVSIKLEVKYLAGAEAMTTARKIISVAEKFAEPLLDAYPAASQILSSSTATIDEVAKEERHKPPNSLTDYIIAENVINGGRSQTLAFLLPTTRQVRKAEWEAAADSTATETTTETHTVRYPKGLTPCSDQPFALCELASISAEVEGDYCYQEVPIEIPYVTITLRSYEEVYDPMVLLAGTDGTCSLVGEAKISGARSYLEANRSLFHPEDAAQVASNLEAAERYMRGRELIRAGDVPALIEFLNREGSPRFAPWTAQGECRHWDCAEGDEACLALDPCGRLAEDAWAIWACNDKLWGQQPARYVAKLWDDAFDGEQSCNGEDGSQKKVGSACELAYLGRLLTQVFAQVGRSNLDISSELTDDQLKKLEEEVFSKAPTLAHFYWRLRGLQSQLLNEIQNLDAEQLCEDTAAKAKRYVSLYCKKCDKALETKASRCSNEWKTSFGEEQLRLEDKVHADLEATTEMSKPYADKAAARR